ncbi:hypothetical protein VNO77_03017 [Canavalia gladiata]|uniref:Uncharacterized protein n=1 Tax=Canavalia gladiata TaxID=3824 RepID=A0AAN9R7S1_CANGL
MKPDEMVEIASYAKPQDKANNFCFSPSSRRYWPSSSIIKLENRVVNSDGLKLELEAMTFGEYNSRPNGQHCHAK